MRAFAVIALLGIAKPPPLVPEPLVTACENKPVGAPCTVDFGGTKKSGVCNKLQDGTLACTPPRKRRP